MYTRPPQGRFPKGMRIPQNYSGNTFRSTAEDVVIPHAEEGTSQTQPPESYPRPYVSDALPPYAEFDQEATAVSYDIPERNESRDNGPREACEKTNKEELTQSPGFRLSLKTLFPGLGKSGSGFGSEELLLLALILLLSGGDGNDDLVLLLVLLLLVR